MKKTHKPKRKLKKWVKFLIALIIIMIIIICSISIYDLSNKPKGNENITTKLNTDSDFYNWFVEFDNLYQSKIPDINYSLTPSMIEQISKFLSEEENNNITYKNNIYYIDEYNTIELDTYTRSLRHILYNDQKEEIEILEINLKNGKYYIQLVTNKYIYKITLNNNKQKIKQNKNKGNVEVSNSIFNTLDFKW